MATAPSSVPSPAPVRRGFGGLCCPKCEAPATISVDLDDLSGDQALTCRDCEESFSVDLVRSMLLTWAPVVAWLDTAPPVPFKE